MGSNPEVIFTIRSELASMLLVDQYQRSLAQRIVSIVVPVYFILGIALSENQFVRHSARIRPLDKMIKILSATELFNQDWKMFAPPPKERFKIGLSIHFSGGWTELKSITEVMMGPDYEKRQNIWAHAGESRITSLFSPVHQQLWNSETKSIISTDELAEYFSNFSRYLCKKYRDQKILEIQYYYISETIPRLEQLENSEKFTPEITNQNAIFLESCQEYLQ